MIQFKPEICRDVDAALRREWLETNGLGGFASSTIIGLNTRRYHGLLVAATKPPVGRFVLLSKLEETLFIEGQAFELSANRYPGVVHPQGFRYLKQFRLDPFPVFTYEVEGIEIEKSVFMIQGENSTVVHYELKKNNHPESPKNLWLELRPLIAFRDYHSTTHENGAINRDVEERSDLASVSPYQGLPSLYLAHNSLDLRKTGDWYRNFEYDAERERGLDFSEDLFNPLVLRFDLRLRRQGRRLGRHAAPRQAGRNPGALVQRSLHHGRPGPQVRRRSRVEALSKYGGRGELEFQSSVLEREDRLLIRRGKRRLARSLNPPEPDLRRQPASQHVVSGAGEKRGRKSSGTSAHAIRPTQPCAKRSPVPWPIHGRPNRARWRLSPGNRLAVVDGTVHRRLRKGQRGQ